MRKINIENNSITDLKKVFLSLKNDNLIDEIRTKSDKNTIYESLELFFINDYKFKIFFELNKVEIEEVILHWVDGPIYQSSWEEVNEKKLNQEFNLLKKMFESLLKTSPIERNREYFWKKEWGGLSIIKNPRDFNVIIYLKLYKK